VEAGCVDTGKQYVAFWSYSRVDDQNDRKWLTELKCALEGESRALSGKVVEIFQDVSSIAWGEQWSDKLKACSEQSRFLIPIITPNYFKSDACRSELEMFLKREDAACIHQLILPLYYITCPEMENVFRKEADWLAKRLSRHNYQDIRDNRHKDLDSDGGRQMVRELATALLARLKGVSLHHLSSDKIQASIVTPRPGSRVPHWSAVVGTLGEVSEYIDIWLVVEVDSTYHPQVRLRRSETNWQSVVAVGREARGLDADHEFQVHVLAVTEDVDEAFQRYLTDEERLRKWQGVPTPQNRKILATVKVIRDNS
jgi:hypothetical protein